MIIQNLMSVFAAGLNIQSQLNINFVKTVDDLLDGNHQKAKNGN
jgi:hypothetical protein